MTTFNTGIPMRRRNIQPPPIPVVQFTVNKTITGYPNDLQIFNINVTSDNGYSLLGVPLQQTVPLLFQNLQYGTYTITENTVENYSNTSITPSTFTLNAENPQQVVEIVNTYQLGYVTIRKIVTGHPENEAYFHITLTGQSAEPTIVDGWVKQGEPITFDELPFDEYVLTEEDEEGYTFVSINPATIEITEGDPTVVVTVTNEMFTGKITITKVII